MAVKRALVNYNGIIKELLDGDSLYGTGGGGEVSFQYLLTWLTDGTNINIPLSPNGEVLCWNSSGSQFVITVNGVGSVLSWLSDGSQSNIPALINNTIQAWLSDGSNSNISLVGG